MAVRVERRGPVQRPLLRGVICVAFATSLIAVGVLLFEPVWATNDDPTMVAFVNGDYTGGVAGRLIYIHVVVGRLLAFLYSWSPRVPWYSLMLWACWVAACSTTLFVALSGPRGGRGVRLGLAVAAVGIAYPGAALVVTFTSGAFAIGLTGLLLLTLAATRRGFAAGLAAGLGGASLTLSAMIRWDSFLGVVLAFLPVWALVAFRTGIRRGLAVTGAIAIVAVGGHGLDRLAYTHHDEWRAYDELRLAHRALLRENKLSPSSEALSAAARELGWDHVEIGLLLSFVFTDPDVYTVDALETLVENVPAQRSAEPSEVFGITVKPYAYFAWALGGICLVHVLRVRRLLPSLWIVGSVAWFCAVIGYLAMYVRFPERTAVPFWATAVIVAAVVPDVLLASRERQRPARRLAPVARTTVVGAVAIALAAITVNATHRIDDITRQARDIRARYAGEASVLREVDPEGVFIGVGASVTTTGIGPLDTTTTFGDLDYVELGWATFSPHFNRRLAGMGITDVFGSLVHDEGVYFVGPAPIVDYLEIFLQRHHGWKVEFRELARVRGSKSVWAAEESSGGVQL